MNNSWAHKMLDLFEDSRMYGTVTFTMHDGHVKRISREETYIESVVETVKRDNRSENARSYTGSVACTVGTT